MKVTLSNDIITTYDAERAKKSKGEIIPEACFGHQSSLDIYKLAKWANANDQSFDVIGIEPNKHLGTAYDLVSIIVGKYKWSIRRKWLNVVQEGDTNETN